MEDSGFWLLSSVSDAQLRGSLGELLASGSRTEARIIAHLAEIEERRLHLRDGSESLYGYCTHVLRLSNSEAFHRITAARIARRFPIVFALLEQRALHLTAICLLRDHLTLENHRELLNAASHKTKVQVEELVARRFPRPDVESRIRKLPASRAKASLMKPLESQPLKSQPLEPQPLEPQPLEPQPLEPQPFEPQPLEPQPLDSVGRRPAASSPRAVDGNVPAWIAAPASESAIAFGRRNEPQPRPIEPLSEARYRIQLNASAALKQKLDHLRELTSHANATGDIAVVIERALDVAIERAERERFAKIKRANGAEHPRQGDRSLLTPEETPLSAAGTQRKVWRRKRKHFANAVLREVVARDQERCTYVGEDGCRCAARAFLQVHHEHSWARGGDDTAGNLRLLCASHNRLLAEQEFGTRYVAQRAEAQQTRTRAQAEARRTRTGAQNPTAERQPP